ncbi:unnamed protein product [Medioppia subpectinata]|uniref:Protein NDNF n=1 Tax=Medioppia subpectinata TaxID=1979941 RepID=A0A7R9LA37_9ACAR|nr:unnamed protein product [Medioppia subpectinata]CAG2117203.1 unnamed protein product [Medioppia subpectinata]
MFLTSYTGSDRHTYSNISSPPGLYVLDFNSLGKDVSVKIYVSQYYPYPLLPNEPDIHVVSVRSDEVVISWPPSPSEAIATIDYCVSIGTNKKWADNCLLDTYLKEEESYELDLLPSEAITSFSYWWVRTVKNMLRQSRLKSMADHSVRVECIGKQTAHTLRRLDNRRHNQYFIDVYARNTVTNSTSMYRTVNVTLINTEPIVVSDDQNIVIKLNQTNNFTQILHYKTLGGDGGTDTTVDKLWLFLQTCTGFGPIRMTGTAVTSANPNVTTNTAINRTLFTQNIFSLKTLEFNVNDGRRKTTIDHKNQSLIVFAISSGANTDRTAVFTLSKRHNRFLYPLLPEDTKLKVMATLTDCRSVTLAWNASPDDKVQYCIYVREANHHHTSSSNVIAPVDNACVDQGLTIGSEANNNDIDSDDTNDSLRKVLCKRYHKSSKRRFNNKIIQSVRGLSSGQTYVFLVMITKYRGKTLAYEQVWATTRPKYQC